MQPIIELVKYGFCGVVTTAFNLVAFYLMTRFGVVYVVANIASYVLAVLLSYIFNDKYVFRHQTNSTPIPKLIKFIMIRVASIAIDSSLLYIFVTILHKNMMLSKLVISAGIIIATYIFNKFFVFKEPEERDKP